MKESKARTVPSVALLGLLAALPGCMQADEAAVAIEAASRPGPWSLPPDVRRIGERQYVAYDAAPPWNGGANCSGRLHEGTREVGQFLLRRFPQITYYGGYSCRPNTADTSRLSVHGTGRALDIFIPMDRGAADNDRGDPVANWLVTHAESIGVQYIVWDQWDWNASLSGRKDTPYGGPNPHIDHIHMELSHEGARRNTPWFRDRDGDGVNNDRDNCPSEANAGQEDRDGDGVGNRCDNCPGEANERQLDTDDDGVGDRCDNCPRERNAMQEDTDGDGRGNRCDNCDGVPNPGQVDTDGDGRGNACDGDDDDDGVGDEMDNCPIVANPMQGDRDGDGRGDRCDGDADGDGVNDDTDNCPRHTNPDQADANRDREGDACDDTDGDGVLDATDVCRRVSDPAQSDLDGDRIGDACDDDVDGDGLGGAIDPCPEVADASSADLDGDGHGDGCDPDADGDGALDDVDTCPGLANPDQADRDSDGIGDACDGEPDTTDMVDPGPAHEEDVPGEETDGGESTGDGSDPSGEGTGAADPDTGEGTGAADPDTGEEPGSTPIARRGAARCAIGAGAAGAPGWLVALVVGIACLRARRASAGARRRSR